MVMGVIGVSKAAAKKKLKTCNVLIKAVRTQKRKRSNMDSDLAAKCKFVLEKLIKHPHSYPFSDPVAVVGFRDSDYFDVIKHPMDLGTVKKKLDTDKYNSAVEFESDVRLTFDNAIIYNPRHNLVHHYAEELIAIFDHLWKSIMVKETAVASKDVKTTRCCLENNNDSTMSTKRKVSHASNKKASVLNSKRVSAHQVINSTVLNRRKVAELQPTKSEVYDYEEGEIHEHSPSKVLRVSKLKRQVTGTVLKVHETLHMQQSQPSSDTVTDNDQANKKQKKVADSELELKLLRQKEREAARVALEKMEKSVDIDNNFNVMREMEALVGFPIDYEPLWPGVDQVLKRVSDDHVLVQNLNNVCLQVTTSITEVGSQSQQGTEVEISSSKALRVAMLKRQFAGTILKAQQTLMLQSQLGGGTTNQDEVAKFEKEKAKQVAELEIEVKRLRQKEREAARMALEKLEQSVDVEDNFCVMREMETLFGCPVAFAPLWCI